MYGIAFDLNPAKAEQHHPAGVTRARAEIDDVLGDQGFRPVQPDLYVCDGVRWPVVHVRLEEMCRAFDDPAGLEWLARHPPRTTTKP